jgi:hypothetical protein
MERGVSFDGCPIANDLLAEIVVKRVMEEQMWRDHPEEFKAMAERRRGIWKSSPLSRKDKG